MDCGRGRGRHFCTDKESESGQTFTRLPRSVPTKRKRPLPRSRRNNDVVEIDDNKLYGEGGILATRPRTDAAAQQQDLCVLYHIYFLIFFYGSTVYQQRGRRRTDQKGGGETHKKEKRIRFFFVPDTTQRNNGKHRFRPERTNQALADPRP